MYLGSLCTLLPQDEDGNAKVGKDIRLYECKYSVVQTADENFGMIHIESQSGGILL